jgi:hypothetical protein
VGFVVDKVELEQVFLQILQFYSVNFIPTVLHENEKKKTEEDFMT